MMKVQLKNTKALSLMVIFHVISPINIQAQDLDVDSARQAYQQAEAAAQKAEQEYEQKLQEFQPLEQRLNQAKSRVQSAERRIAELKAELNDTHLQLNDLEQQIIQLKNELQEAEHHYLDLGDQLSQLQGLEQELSDTLVQINRELDDVIKIIEELREELHYQESLCEAQVDIEEPSRTDPDHPPHDQNPPIRDHHKQRKAVVQQIKNKGLAQLYSHREETHCRSDHGECAPSGCAPELILSLEDELDTLSTKRRSLTSKRSHLRRKIANVQLEISSTTRLLANADLSVKELRNNISQIELTHQSQDRHYGQTMLELQQAVNELSEARQVERESQRLVDEARPEVEQAYEEWQKLKEAESRARQYLREVTANYNMARDQVIKKAASLGWDHGLQEAQERATRQAITKGRDDGTLAGFNQGSQLGRTLAYNHGYRLGRQQSSGEAFEQGRQRGIQLADLKARLENFPRGFNDAKEQALRQTPVQEDLIDMTETSPTQPGSSGVDLTLVKKKIMTRPAPYFAMPTDPNISVPSAPTPSSSVPQIDGSHFAPDCSTVILPEFEEICRISYTYGYRKAYERNYTQIFAREYRIAYKQAAEKSYQEAREASYEADHKRGFEQGALEAGILKGFSERLASAMAKQYELGQNEFKTQLDQGSLLVVHQVALSEISKDGVLMPGEKALLNITIDNLGGMPTHAENIVVELKTAQGLKQVSVNTRSLPALKPHTRTQLIGVLNGINAREFAGEQVQMRVKIKNSDGLIHEATVNATTHFPLELTNMDFTKTPTLNQWTEAKLTFRNLSNQVSPLTTIKLKSDPGIVNIDDRSIELESLEPGASTQVTVRLAPGVYAGGNNPVKFSAHTLSDDGEIITTQSFNKIVPVKRNASIELFDQYNRPITGPLYVRAGSRLRFKAQFKFEAQQRLPGPFIMRWSRKTSHESIRPSNGSTTGVNFGSWSPRTRTGKTEFSFDIPYQLRGHKGWIMLELREGNQLLHAPLVKFVVK